MRKTDMNKLRVSIMQIDLFWEDKAANLKKLSDFVATLSGKTDLIVLPEMFSTGFTMKSNEFSETIDGKTISVLKSLSKENDVALCGSFVAKDGENYFNRGFFIEPKGIAHYYDKRHLFRMGEEPKHYREGNNRLIVSYKHWKICLMICYDLRFPVWSRNFRNEYDLLIYVANWPAPRAKAWEILLRARAIENMAYVCGVNRIGSDGIGLKYSGNSVLLDARGQDVIACSPEIEEIVTAEISLDELNKLRTKFPAWKDGDKFEIK